MGGKVIDCHEHTGLAHEMAWQVYQRWRSTGVELGDLNSTVYLFMERCATRYDPEKINPATGQPYAWSTYFVAAVNKSQAGIVADAMGEKRSRNQQNLRSRVATRELDAPRYGSESLSGRELVEAPAERDHAGDAETVREVLAFMARLEPVSADVFYYRFVRGETLMQVKQRVGMSRGRVQQIHHELLELLREAAREGRCPRLRDAMGLS